MDISGGKKWMFYSWWNLNKIKKYIEYNVQISPTGMTWCHYLFHKANEVIQCNYINSLSSQWNLNSKNN